MRGEHLGGDVFAQTVALCLLYHADTFTHLARVLNHAACAPEPDAFHRHLADGLRAQFPDYPCAHRGPSANPTPGQLLFLLARPYAAHAAYLRPPVLSLSECWCHINLALTWLYTAALLLPPLRRRLSRRLQLAWLNACLVTDLLLPLASWGLLRSAPPSSVRHYPPVACEALGYTALACMPAWMVYLITAYTVASMSLVALLLEGHGLEGAVPYSLPGLLVQTALTAVAVMAFTSFRERMWVAMRRWFGASTRVGATGPWAAGREGLLPPKLEVTAAAGEGKEQLALPQPQSLLAVWRHGRLVGPGSVAGAPTVPAPHSQDGCVATQLTVSGDGGGRGRGGSGGGGGGGSGGGVRSGGGGAEDALGQQQLAALSVAEAKAVEVAAGPGVSASTAPTPAPTPAVASPSASASAVASAAEGATVVAGAVSCSGDGGAATCSEGRPLRPGCPAPPPRPMHTAAGAAMRGSPDAEWGGGSAAGPAGGSFRGVRGGAAAGLGLTASSGGVPAGVASPGGLGSEQGPEVRQGVGDGAGGAVGAGAGAAAYAGAGPWKLRRQRSPSALSLLWRHPQQQPQPRGPDPSEQLSGREVAAPQPWQLPEVSGTTGEGRYSGEVLAVEREAGRAASWSCGGCGTGGDGGTGEGECDGPCEACAPPTSHGGSGGVGRSLAPLDGPEGRPAVGSEGLRRVQGSQPRPWPPVHPPDPRHTDDERREPQQRAPQSGCPCLTWPWCLRARNDAAAAAAATATAGADRVDATAATVDARQGAPTSSPLTVEELRAMVAAARVAPYCTDPTLQLARVTVRLPGLTAAELAPGWREATLGRMSRMLPPGCAVLSLAAFDTSPVPGYGTAAAAEVAAAPHGDLDGCGRHSAQSSADPPHLPT